jgi:hypothetical protein
LKYQKGIKNKFKKMRKQSFTIALSAIFFMAIAFIACTKSAPINTTQKAVAKKTRGLVAPSVISSTPQACCTAEYRIYSSCKEDCFKDLDYAYGDPANLGSFPANSLGSIQVNSFTTPNNLTAYDFELCALDGSVAAIQLNIPPGSCTNCNFKLVSFDANGKEVFIGYFTLGQMTVGSKKGLVLEFVHNC